MENSQTIDLERALDTSQPAQSRLPEGVAPTFPTSLGTKSMTDTAKTAGSTAPMTPTIDYSAIGTQATQPIDTTPVEEFKQEYGGSKDILDTIAAAGFLDVAATKEADAITSRIEQLTEESVEADRADLQEKVGIPDLETQLADILSEAQTIKASLTKGLVSEERRVVPMEVIIGRQAQLRRQAAAELEGLAAVASTLEGKINNANNRIDRALDRKYGVIKAEIDAQKQLLARIETKEAAQQSAKLTKLETQLNQELEKEKEAMKSITTAMGNGLSSSVGADLMGKLTNGQISPSEVFASTGGYLRDPLEKAIKQAQLKKLNLEIQDYYTSDDVMSGEFGSAVADASGLVGVERGKIIKRNMTQAIKDGDYSRAFNQAANAVEESLTGENKTSFASQRIMYNALAGLQDAINEYEENDGDMNLLRGTADDISNKLLGVTGDPKLTELAVQLNREFQKYRQEMTGAAFSPEESRDYAKVNPRPNATLELNTAIINGSKNQLENRILSTMKNKVSGSEKLWNIATGQSTQEYLDLTDQILSSDSDPLGQYLNELEFENTTSAITQ